MSVGLYVFGVLICAAGVLMVGFGIPINEFSLGNTLIIAGTSAIAGGMIVIGLAAAVRQLRRIADALAPRGGTRPAARPAADAVEPVVVPAARPSAGRAPLPVKPPRPESREPRIDQPGARSAEPRLPSSGIEPPEEAIIERPRPAASRAGHTPIMEDSGDTPLSPRPPFRPNFQPPPPADAPDLVETKSWTSMPPFERFRNAATADRRTSTTSETIARATPPSGFFDSVWPARRDAEPKVDAATQNAPEVRAPDLPGDAPQSDEPQPVSILKSGVVDGMAYTLYTDGSIEAELAEGVLRFASIEELRMHLEKQG